MDMAYVGRETKSWLPNSPLIIMDYLETFLKKSDLFPARCYDFVWLGRPFFQINKNIKKVYVHINF